MSHFSPRCASPTIVEWQYCLSNAVRNISTVPGRSTRAELVEKPVKTTIHSAARYSHLACRIGHWMGIATREWERNGNQIPFLQTSQEISGPFGLK